MKKKNFNKKLTLKKEIVANLSSEEMKKFFAGAEPTIVGATCATEVGCCKPKTGYCGG